MAGIGATSSSELPSNGRRAGSVESGHGLCVRLLQTECIVRRSVTKLYRAGRLFACRHCYRLEIAPRLTHVGVVFNPKVSPIAEAYANAIVAAAPNFGLRAVAAGVLNLAEIDAAMADLGREPDGGLIIPPDNFTSTHHKRAH